MANQSFWSKALHGPPPPPPPQVKTNWLGMTKVDRDGHARTKRTKVGGGGILGMGGTFQTYAKQHNSAMNYKKTVERGGGTIDQAYETPEGLVLSGHDSHGNATEVRIEFDGRQVPIQY